MSVTSAILKSYMALSVVLGQDIKEGVYIFDPDLTLQLFTTADNELEQQQCPGFRTESRNRPEICKYYYPEGFSVENLQDENLYNSVPGFMTNEAAGAMAPEHFNGDEYAQTWPSIGIYIESMKAALKTMIAAVAQPEISVDPVTKMYLVKLPPMQRARPKMPTFNTPCTYKIKFDPEDHTILVDELSESRAFTIAPASQLNKPEAISSIDEIKAEILNFCHERVYYKNKFDKLVNFCSDAEIERIVNAWIQIDSTAYALQHELSGVVNGKWSCSLDVNDVEFSMSNQIYFPYITLVGKTQNPETGKDEEHKYYIPLVIDERIISKIRQDQKFQDLFVDSHKTKTTSKATARSAPRAEKYYQLCIDVEEFMSITRLNIREKYDTLVSAIADLILVENDTGYITYPIINMDPSILGTNIIKFSTNTFYGMLSKHIVSDERLCNPLIPYGICTEKKQPSQTCTSKPSNVDEKEYIVIHDFLSKLLTDQNIQTSTLSKTVKSWRGMIDKFFSNYALCSRPTNAQGKPTGKITPGKLLMQLKQVYALFLKVMKMAKRCTQGYLNAHDEIDTEEMTEHKAIKIIDMILGNTNLGVYFLSSYFDECVPKYAQKLITELVLNPIVIRAIAYIVPVLLPFVLPVGVYHPSYPQLGNIYNGSIDTVEPFINLILTVLHTVNDSSMRASNLVVHSCFLAVMTPDDGSGIGCFTRTVGKLVKVLETTSTASTAAATKSFLDSVETMSYPGYDMSADMSIDLFSV